jgi:type VII secretion-associated serine protease mycosin
VTLRAIRTAVALLSATAVAVLPAAPAHADQIRNDQWHLRYLHVAEAQKISRGKGVTVAVVDSGVDPHPDLVKNLLTGTDIASGSGDGKQDRDSHGTEMAGLIAAHGKSGNNGALGIAPEAKILPIRYFAGGGGQGDSDKLAAGIEWAISKEAKVINVSSAGGSSAQLLNAVQHAISSDVVVVAGVGNTSKSFGVDYPAALDGVLAVGATDRNGNHAEVSVTGPELMICAPGVDIYSTSYKGHYGVSTGTSDATAIVSGAVALIRSKYPDLPAKEVVHRLTATAIDKGDPGRDEEYGYGVLDLVAALTADVPPLEAATPSADPRPTATRTVAAPQADTGNDGSNGLLLATGIVVVVVVVGLLVVLTRRRRDRATGAGGTGGASG